MKLRGVMGVGFLGAQLFTTVASAEREFPKALKDAVGLRCVPQCTVCHTSNLGGLDTVKQDFGKAILTSGKLVPGHPESIPAAVEAVRATAEGAILVERLERGFDPNYDEALGQLACGPTYGCGARVAKAPPPSSGNLAYVLGAALLFALVRRGKR